MPVGTIGDDPLPLAPAGLDARVYVTPPEPTEPAVYGTDTAPLVLLKDAVPIVGALGLIPGVIEFDAEEATDSAPVVEIATTVKVTAVPAVSPVTVIGELEPVAVCPVLDATLYVTDPVLPRYVGAVKGTEALPVVLSNVTVPIVGVPGCFPPESFVAISYAEMSPTNTHVSVPRLMSVA
jgi:hypothetical protein